MGKNMFVFLHTCLKFHCSLKKKNFIKKSSLIHEPAPLSGPQRSPSHIKPPNPRPIHNHHLQTLIPFSFSWKQVCAWFPLHWLSQFIQATEYFLRHFMEAPGFSFVIQQGITPPPPHLVPWCYKSIKNFGPVICRGNPCSSYSTSTIQR